MPVDRFGTRAEIIMDSGAVVKRLNPGQLYEQYVNATSDQVARRVVELMHQGNQDAAWKYLMDYYGVVSPEMRDLCIRELNTPELITNHLTSIINSPLSVWMKPDNVNLGLPLVEGLKEHFPLEFGPVTYRGRSGKMVTTKSPVIIGSTYLYLLEANPESWSAVATAKLQHFGIPAITKSKDKYATPSRENPIRLTGEAEVRLITANVGGDVARELLDMSNCPELHKAQVAAILAAEHPTNINKLPTVPKIGNRALMYVNHVLECGGIRMVYKEYQDESHTS